MKKKIKDLAKHKEKFIDLKDFILIVGGYGFIINFMLWGIFKLPFTFYSFLAYGLLYYFIDVEIIKWIRRIKVK